MKQKALLKNMFQFQAHRLAWGVTMIASRRVTHRVIKADDKNDSYDDLPRKFCDITSTEAHYLVTENLLSPLIYKQNRTFSIICSLFFSFFSFPPNNLHSSCHSLFSKETTLYNWCYYISFCRHRRAYCKIYMERPVAWKTKSALKEKE